MKKLQAIIKKLKRVDEAFLMKKLFMDKTFRQMIISLNTQSQLYDDGIDSRGIKLEDIGGAYSEYTKMLKEAKGQPIDRVTLRDTGEFHESFRVNLVGGDIKITAKTLKDDTDLLKEWGPDILGLTDENLQLLIDKARVLIVPAVREYLFAA